VRSGIDAVSSGQSVSTHTPSCSTCIHSSPSRSHSRPPKKQSVSLHSQRRSPRIPGRCAKAHSDGARSQSSSACEHSLPTNGPGRLDEEPRPLCELVRSPDEQVEQLCECAGALYAIAWPLYECSAPLYSFVGPPYLKAARLCLPERSGGGQFGETYRKTGSREVGEKRCRHRSLQPNNPQIFPPSRLPVLSLPSSLVVGVAGRDRGRDRCHWSRSRCHTPRGATWLKRTPRLSLGGTYQYASVAWSLSSPGVAKPARSHDRSTGEPRGSDPLRSGRRAYARRSASASPRGFPSLSHRSLLGTRVRHAL